MDVHVHLDALQREGDLLATASTDVDPDAPVTIVPDFTLRALVHHIGGIHRWAATTVREARSERYYTTLLEVVGAWPDDADLVEWFRAGHGELVQTLRDADPNLECWHFFASPTPVAFWARRQTHETAIHRADTESASGAITPYPHRARGRRDRRPDLRVRRAQAPVRVRRPTAAAPAARHRRGRGVEADARVTRQCSVRRR